MQNGMEQEARNVFHLKQHNALATLGYRELFSYFEGETTLEQAVDLIKQHSRNYAKRQLTWWRRDTEIIWLSPMKIGEIVERIGMIE